MAWWADGNSPSVWSEKARSVSGWIFLGPRTLYCASNRCGEDALELVFDLQVPRVRVVDEVVVAKISMFFVLLQMMAVGSSCKFLIVV